MRSEARRGAASSKCAAYGWWRLRTGEEEQPEPLTRPSETEVLDYRVAGIKLPWQKKPRPAISAKPTFLMITLARPRTTAPPLQASSFTIYSRFV